MLVIASSQRTRTDITTAVASLVPCCSPAKLGVKKSRYAQFWLHTPFLPNFWLCPVSLRAEEPLEKCSEWPVVAGQDCRLDVSVVSDPGT